MSSLMNSIQAALDAANAAANAYGGSQASFGPGPSWTPEESQAAIAANNAVIQKEVAALKNDADINAYLAKTTYTPEQLSLATGYNQADIAQRMGDAWRGQATQNTQQWLDSAYAPTSTQAQTPGFVIGGSSLPSVAPNLNADYWLQIYRNNGVTSPPDTSGAYGAGFDIPTSQTQVTHPSVTAPVTAPSPESLLPGYSNALSTVNQRLEDRSAAALGGLGQVAAAAHVPVAQSVSTPASSDTNNAVSDAAIQNWFAANPGWTPETLKAYMASYGITPEQVARATGNRPEVLVERYNRTGRLPVQKGAQTQYVDYTQPLAPVAEGAGSGNLPYYYNTPKGQIASYLPPAYWRGNVQAYGGAYPFAQGGAVKLAPSSTEWLRAKCNG